MLKKIVFMVLFVGICSVALFPASDSISKVFNYPNPFKPSKGETTKIAFNYVNNTGVTINNLVYYAYIYDIAGHKVMVKKNTEASVASGSVRVEFVWNGRNDKGSLVAPGIYFIKIVTDSYTASGTNSNQSLSKYGKMMVQ